MYVGQHFSFVRAGKATDGEPRSEPDWGNPTVRDRRGACGNVDYGGTRHPPRVSKERVLETLRLTLCAPQIYPDLLQQVLATPMSLMECPAPAPCTTGLAKSPKLTLIV